MTTIPNRDGIATAAATLRTAEAERDAARLTFARALTLAHASGMTWTAVAEAAGLESAENARTKAREGRDVLTAALRRQLAAANTRPEPLPEKTTDPGLSVSEAAARLGVTRQTVYNRIQAGVLRFTENEAGRPRVLLDDGPVATPGSRGGSTR